MKLKLQTKISISYAMIFTIVLIAINTAVFLTVRFYNTSSDNQQIQRTKEIVETLILRDGKVRQNQLIDKGVVFPMVVKVESGDKVVYSMAGAQIRSAEGGDVIAFHYLDREVTHNSIAAKFEFIGPGQVSHLVTIAKSTEESVYNRQVTIVTTAIASLLGAILSLVAGSSLSHQSLEPISNIRRSVEAMKEDNLHDRIRVPNTGDELTDLGNTFNSLLDRLDTAYQRQVKFVSDASHELRTPLTVIKGYNDLLQRWGKNDPEILEEAIAAIKDETANMANLVENLLFIAKGENKKLNVTPEKFNLLELIQEVTQETQMSNPSRKIAWEGESLEIYADKKMIKQMLRVFIENSIKFTGEDGTIKTTLHKSGGTNLEIKVWDNGEGISEEDSGRIFERFYVAEKARTKDKSGSGLGLSIAKWIADVHRGTITVNSRVGEYTEFSIILPSCLNKVPVMEA